VLEENYSIWESRWQRWLHDLLYCICSESSTEDYYPTDQIYDLLQVVRKYLLNGCVGVVDSMYLLAGFPYVQEVLLKDDEVYNVMKKEMADSNVKFFVNLTQSEAWQLKIMRDKHFIDYLLVLPETKNWWNLVINIAQHPDAKTLLPHHEVIAKASTSSFPEGTDVCALLCSENDLQDFKLVCNLNCADKN